MSDFERALVDALSKLIAPVVERVLLERINSLLPLLTPITVDKYRAEELTGLSWRTLERLADSGEPVGRLRVMTRVVYHVPTLNEYMRKRAEAQVKGTK